MELLDSGVNNGVNNGPKRTGAVLADARTAAGIELIDIARETRIPLRHLKAIEAERHEDLPALPYAIGFVKTYARAVGLDPEVVATQFRSETTKSAHVPTPLTLEPLDERRLPARALVVASIVAVVLVIAALSAWGGGMFDKPAPAQVAVVDEQPILPTPLDPAALTPAADVGAAAVTAVVPAAPLPVGAVAGPVVLTAREPVWVRIFDKETNTTARIGVLQAGESYTVPREPVGLMLWTGKAGALDVTVGGRAIPALGGPVETVRDLSLAPANLIARANGVSASAAPPASASAADGGTAAAAPSSPRPIAQVPPPRPDPKNAQARVAPTAANATRGV